MDIKELNEAISKALREDDFYDTFDALKIEIANDLDNGSLGNNDFELEAHIEGIDIKDLRKRFREIVLSGIAECVREGTNCMDAMEVLISKDSIKAEDFDGILEDLYNLFNKSDDEIEEIRKGKEINLYCNWSIELPLKESLNSEKKNLKEEMEYNRKIWDIFEENVAEYLNEHGVKPEGNNVMNYISKNAVEIVKAVLEKEYNYEEDDQAIFELYYNCPIHFTDKAQAIDKLLEEYLAESLKRCLTIEDKLLQISSLDKNESVTDKKVIKESNGETVYVLMDADDSDILSVYSAESLIEYAEWHRQEILKLADGENIGWDKINDIPNAIEFLTEAKDFKVFTEIVQ